MAGDREDAVYEERIAPAGSMMAPISFSVGKLGLRSELRSVLGSETLGFRGSETLGFRSVNDGLFDGEV